MNWCLLNIIFILSTEILIANVSVIKHCYWIDDQNGINRFVKVQTINLFVPLWSSLLIRYIYVYFLGQESKMSLPSHPEVWKRQDHL